MINNKKCRLIARLDIKGANLIKGIHLEGLRVIGDPQVYAQRYYQEGIDELLYIDTVASLYERNNLTEVVKKTAQSVFIPMIVGGGIRSIVDVEKLLKSGADKIAINTAAVRNPYLIKEISNAFGSQCVVLSVEAKSVSKEKWEVYVDNGREKTGLDVLEWVQKALDLGVGEILLTSVDREGTKRGFDIPLIRTISDAVNIPVIASGGMGTPNDVVDVVLNGHADAIAVASVLHYNDFSISVIREKVLPSFIQMRKL